MGIRRPMSSKERAATCTTQGESRGQALHGRGASQEEESGGHPLWNTRTPTLLLPSECAYQRAPGSSPVVQPHSEAALALPEYQLSRENPVRKEV